MEFGNNSICLRPGDFADLYRKLKDQRTLQKLTGAPYQVLFE